jgi:hypothetical protein
MDASVWARAFGDVAVERMAVARPRQVGGVHRINHIPPRE